MPIFIKKRPSPAIKRLRDQDIWSVSRERYFDAYYTTTPPPIRRLWLLLMMVKILYILYIPRCVICSAMMMRWEKQVPKQIYIYNSECISVEAVNDTRESEWEIKLWKLRLNFNIVYNIPQFLEFSLLQELNFVFWTRNLVPSRFKEQLSQSSHACYVCVWSLFFAKSFKLQERIFPAKSIKIPLRGKFTEILILRSMQLF